MWSSTLISWYLPASFILADSSSSALLGFKFPLGWLWAKMMETDSDFIAAARINLGSATVPVIPPAEAS